MQKGPVASDGLLKRHFHEGCILSPRWGGGHRGALGHFVKFTNPSSGGSTSEKVSSVLCVCVCVFQGEK